MELDIIYPLEFKFYLTEQVKWFQASCIKNHFSKWPRYTVDKEILGSVSDWPLEFSVNKLPYYHKEKEMRFSSEEKLFLANEGVVKESQHEEGEFISPISLVSKIWRFL